MEKPNISSPYPNEAYEVGWICALPIELAAARQMLDEEYGPPQTPPSAQDSNNYILGSIHAHKVVIASLPRGEVGASSAALSARDLLGSFPNVRVGLMVGIGAGIPGWTADGDNEGSDVRLGDVVISSDKRTGGFVAYNFGKKLADGSFEVAYHLNQPPRALRIALSSLEAEHELRDNHILDYIEEMTRKLSPRIRGNWTHPGPDNDVLFPANYLHQAGKTCKSCDHHQAVRRSPLIRSDTTPVIHYGVIATGSEVVKHAPTRDLIRSRHNAICLEMEAAGLMNNFPCVVIRGISDYADSHKNDQWHRFAAASAAACAKELLLFIRPADVHESAKAADIVGHLQKIEEKLDDFGDDMRNLHAAQSKKQLREWLSAPDIDINFRKALAQHHSGTCSWFLQGRKLRDWMDRGCRNLWIRGLPGSGKTILSARIINALLSDQSQDSWLPPLYFFFDTRDADKQSIESLLRSLVSQLSSISTQAMGVLGTAFGGKFEDGDVRPSCAELAELFSAMLHEAGGKIRIVVDALDECNTQDDVLFWMRSLAPELTNVGFLVTSRDEGPIELAMKDWLDEGENFVSLPSLMIDKDISSYIQWTLQSDKAFSRWRTQPAVLNMMRVEMVKKASGMFRLAACHLQVLKTCIDIGQIEEELKRLPTTLEEMYDRILQKIDSHHHTRVVRILQFLVYSQKPLRAEELVDAAAVDLLREPAFGSDRRMPDPHGILDICPSLLTRVVKQQNQGEETSADFIELAHATVKQYLLSVSRPSIFHNVSDSKLAQGAITTVCLAYLSLINPDESPQALQSKFPLAQFASRHWLSHAQASDSVAEVRKAAIKFLSNDATRRVWNMFYNPDEPWIQSFPLSYEMAAPIYYAALAGLTNTFSAMLEGGAEIENLGGDYSSAIQAASVGGNEDVVRLVVSRDAMSVHTTDGLLGNALQAAATRGHVGILSFLLSHGADVNVKSGKYGSALQAASARGNTQVLQILLAKGADLHTRGGKYTTALFAACTRGHEDSARLLLDHGADCNEEDDKQTSPLQAAVEGGHIGIVRLLLERRANINHQGGLYGDALQGAAVRGYGKIFRLLLDHGADVNAQGGLFGCALQAASARGDEPTVQAILRRGADPNLQGGYYDNSLQAASAHGQVSIVMRLLKEGARVNTGPDEDTDEGDQFNIWHSNHHFSNQSPWSPWDKEIHKQVWDDDHSTKSDEENAKESLDTDNLSELSENELVVGGEYFASVSELLKATNEGQTRGSTFDSNSDGGCHHWSTTSRFMPEAERRLPFGSGRELEKMMLEEDIGLMTQLLSKEPNTWRSSMTDDSILISLSFNTFADLEVKLRDRKLAKGAQCQKLYTTALQAGAAHGYVEVVRLLLQSGSDPNMAGGIYGNALQAASARGHSLVAKVLLEQGADPNLQGGLYGGAIMAAAVHGHHDVVRLLLEDDVELEMNGSPFLALLVTSSARGHEQVVEAVLQNTPYVDLRSYAFQQALYHAADRGHCRIIRLLLDRADEADVEGKYFSSALYAAVTKQHIPVTHLLLQAGADVNCRLETPSFHTVLEEAAFGGNMELVEMLLKAGADVNRRIGDHATALRAVSQGGNVDVLRLLMEYGANPDIETTGWGRMLKAAIIQNNLELVRFLVEQRGENISKADMNMAFTTACETEAPDSRRLDRRPDVVRLLLDAGADVNFTNSLPLQRAAGNGCLEVVRMLLQEGADPNVLGGEIMSRTGRNGSPMYEAPKEHCLLSAAGSGNRDIFDLLLQAIADLGSHEGLIRAAFREAALSGQDDIVKLLMQQILDGDKDAQSLSLWEGLEACIKHGHEKVAKTLIAYGADVNGAFREESLLSLAFARESPSICKLLLDAGAHLDSLTPSPLLEAMRLGNVQILRHILEKGPATVDIQEALNAMGSSDNAELTRALLNWATEQSIHLPLDDALIRAWSRGQASVVGVLLEMGANVNTMAPKRGQSLFFRALIKNRLDIAEQFFEASVDLDIQEDKVLEHASRLRSTKIVKAMLCRRKGVGKGVCVRALKRLRMPEGRGIARLLIQHLFANEKELDQTTVHALRHNEEAVKLLLHASGEQAFMSRSLGAVLSTLLLTGNANLASKLISQSSSRIKACAKTWSMMIAIACSLGSGRTVRALLALGKADTDAYQEQLDMRLQAVAFAGNSRLVEVLLGHGARVNTEIRGWKGQALKAAASNGHPHIVKRFLLAGANIPWSDGNGNALLAAAEGGHRLTVKMLLEAGAELRQAGGSIECIQSQSTADALLASIEHGHVHIAKMLIRDGNASIRTVFRDGLKAAARRGHEEMVKFLLERAEASELPSGVFSNALRATKIERVATLLRTRVSR